MTKIYIPIRPNKSTSEINEEEEEENDIDQLNETIQDMVI